MRHIDLLTERYGDRNVLGGVCLVATVLDADGSFRQLTGLQELAYGDRQDPGSARSHDVDAGLTDAEFTARLSDDIVGEMWEKWVFLASIGAVTCLMRSPVGQVVAAPGGREFAERVVAECAAVAAASMYRDLQQGNPTEADHTIGDLIDRAHVPLLGLTYTHLSVYQSSLAG